MAARSITRPSEVENPGNECPPERAVG
jgi:hypothetical protein